MQHETGLVQLAMLHLTEPISENIVDLSLPNYSQTSDSPARFLRSPDVEGQNCRARRQCCPITIQTTAFSSGTEDAAVMRHDEKRHPCGLFSPLRMFYCKQLATFPLPEQNY